MEKLRFARLEEYVAWLRDHLASGGRITHAYDYPFERIGFLVAQAHFTTDGECGTNAVSVIALPGVRRLGGSLGHNKIYFMDGAMCEGDWVPIFADPEFDGLPGVAGARADAASERRAFAARVHERPRHDSDVSTYRTQAPATSAHTVHADEPVTVNVEPDGTVVLLPRSMPTRLTPDDAETLAYRILAAANRLSAQD